ncbi:hypothetical protein [Mucilaginibacter galii]|nr:hypothetical protein [Mucilaginibacter galii]
MAFVLNKGTFGKIAVTLITQLVNFRYGVNAGASVPIESGIYYILLSIDGSAIELRLHASLRV